LDFAHTGGRGAYKIFERLHTQAELSLWFAISELSLEKVSVTQGDLKNAHQLRWAIWKAANALRESKRPSSKDIKIINERAAVPTLVPMLGENGMQNGWQQPTTTKAALATIARDAIELFSHQDHLPIQQCANHSCPLLFVDFSRAGKRRWCSMQRCGNMTKIAKYRKNKRKSSRKIVTTQPPLPVGEAAKSVSGI
jgi:predicted RNA-binding Zn ribbon-like protein